MKILIAEDNELKLKSVIQFLKRQYNNDSLSIVTVITPSDAIKEVKTKTYDLFILDMSLPVFAEDKKQIRALSGKNILITMKHKRIKTKTIILTQWDVFGHHDDRISLKSLSDELLTKFSSFLLDVAFWDSSSTEWEEKISKIIKAQL